MPTSVSAAPRAKPAALPPSPSWMPAALSPLSLSVTPSPSSQPICSTAPSAPTVNKLSSPRSDHLGSVPPSPVDASNHTLVGLVTPWCRKTPALVNSLETSAHFLFPCSFVPTVWKKRTRAPRSSPILHSKSVCLHQQLRRGCAHSISAMACLPSTGGVHAGDNLGEPATLKTV